jgi:hypothetical protein
MGEYKKAQGLLEKVPALIEKRKARGRNLPTEVFIKKKRQLLLFFPFFLPYF